MKVNEFLKDFDDDSCNIIEIYDRHNSSTQRSNKKTTMSDFGHYTVRSWGMKQMPHLGNILRITIQSSF